tara:strand:+ start:3394 stop:3573 length:180 start_codon:yes stop_codon:yes gene_type:complete
MATFRVGVGSFNIQDGAVGFGTDTDGLGNLKVKGVTKTTDQSFLVHQHSLDTLVLLQMN